RVFPAGKGLRFVLSGDFDQDGDPDLMTTDRQGHSLTLLYNGASGAEPARPFLEEICTPADFHTLAAAASDSSSVQRFLKYTLNVGAVATQLPDVAYQNTNLYPLHEEFLRSEFPDQFPALSPKLYDDLVGVRASRQYFVGAISRLATDTAPVYGFSVFAKFNDPLERLSADEVKAIYEKLRESFHVEPLEYFPNSRAAVGVAREWVEPGFPIQFETASGVPTTYEPYTLATGIGRVRILSAEEFETANSNGEFSFQDILVLPQAPRDIEGVVSGVVTAEPQGELSHVAVRTNRRGTPNAFVSEALELLTPLAGRLVRLEVACSGLVISEATPEEAQEFWERRRPTLSAKPSVDPDFTGFPDLTEIAALDTADEGFPSEARVGGKATAMARLQTVLDGDLIEYGEVGFAIPVHYYLEFMRSNQIPSAIDPQHLVTYEQYVNELANDPMFLTDPRFRFAALETLRLHIEDLSQISNLLVAQLTARIVEVFGSSFLRVRFRSSSNVEDALEFNGAGLYDSTSVCAADDLDSDTAGPSLCQQFKSNERGVARGLRKVWASLWNFRAYEERAFYGIPNDRVAMAVFVSRAFPDERANGVAFTGNPTNARDRRYVVTVQLGEESVVTPEPGVLPEKDVLEVENGKVERIIRAVPSSLLPRDNYVLSDDELNELGALMWRIDQGFPLDTGAYDRSEVLLDMEIKIEQSGELAVKQVRPFLLTNAAPPSPTFQLLVSPGTSSCGMFTQGRGVLTEYELKSTVRLNSGNYSLPTDVETFASDLIEEILIGPDRQPATPINSGLFSMQKIDAGGGEFIYRFGYTQDFELPGGERFELILSELDFVAGECTEEGETRVLDADALTDSLFLQGNLLVGESLQGITYSACGHETLPHWEIEAELADGTQIVLKERFRPELFRDFGPASLTYAAVDFSGIERTERDYFNLVYSSTRHNEYTVYMTVFDTPVTLDGLSVTVRAIELHAPVPREGLGARAFYLDDQLSVIAEREVVSYTKERLEAEQLPVYRRGDVNGNGLALSDAMLILGHLFSATAVPPACEKSADVDDSGVLNVRDPLWILLYLFAGGGAPPEPFLACGGDPTPDDLKCASPPVCE
ncbi:MAG: hypothetical protein MK538_03815, partial [Planctomycetes bacterium]|nr:hypothetical protein [Planctomycetota bacterium]